MKKVSLFALLVISLAAVSCRLGVMQEARKPAEPVSFTASLNGFDVKATDSALETGDQVGIFAGDPISVANVKATVSGSVLTPDNPIYWEKGQLKNTTFAAYLPYSASLNSSTSSFSVKADQSTYSAYQASDLMAASATAAPRTVVAFAFKHVLSKLTVVPTCEDPSETVTAVTVQELVSEATADLQAGTVGPGAAKSAIKAGAATEGNGARGFVCILVPQTVQLKLTVTTSKGRSLDYSLTQPSTLQGGTAYKADITVAAQEPGPEPIPATPADFTITIVDWGTPESLSFLGDDDYTQMADGKWSVVGLGGDWNSDFWMEETSEGVWEIDITYAAGESFKLRQDGKWSTETETHAEAGMPADATGPVPADGSEYGLWASGGKDITLPQSGTYHLKFLPEGYLFYATLTSSQGPSITELYLLGGATDTGWSLDDMEQLTRSGDLFSITANLKADQKFRFPLQKQPNAWWPCLVRGEGEGAVKIGTSDANDDDQFTVSQDGSYEIVIDVSAMTIAITRKGDRVEKAVEINELYILGAATDNGWSLDTMPQLEKDGSIFTITTHLKAGTLADNTVFRFPMQRVAGKWWPCLVKGATDGSLMVGTGDGDASRQFTVDTSGTYLITIDASAMTISIVLQNAD